MSGFLTKARQETGADHPKFGAGGSWVDIDAMVAREVVFGITAVDYDGDNTWDGKPRPRWNLDIIPWYEGELLPGKAGDDGRLTQLEAGKLSLACHQSRDGLMERLQQQIEKGLADNSDFVEGPGVLVKIRVPGGRGGRYIDLCGWDEDREAPILAKGAEPAADAEPRRPTGRSAPGRAGQTRRPPTEEPASPPDRTAATSRRSAPASRQGSQNSEPPSSGFADAGGPESGGQGAAAAPAQPITAADLKIVAAVVGGQPYEDGEELASEYELEEGQPFPGIKEWLTDHGVHDFPSGRGRLKSEYRDAYSIALRCWMLYTGRDAQGQPVAEPYVAGGPDHTRPYNEQPARVVREAELPSNAREANERTRPAGADDVDLQGQPRAAGRRSWMPPDEAQRRSDGGPRAASEHVYSPGDVGDSVDACPGCNRVVTGRALPMGGGSFGIMHQCDGDGVTRPLQATNIRKEATT